MIVATASEVKNAFGKYIDMARIEGEVLIQRHGHIVAKIVGVKHQNHAFQEVEKEDSQDN